MNRQSFLGGMGRASGAAQGHGADSEGTQRTVATGGSPHPSSSHTEMQQQQPQTPSHDSRRRSGATSTNQGIDEAATAMGRLGPGSSTLQLRGT